MEVETSQRKSAGSAGRRAPAYGIKGGMPISRLPIVTLGGLLFGALLAPSSTLGQGPPKDRPVPVVVAPVTEGPVQQEVGFIGSVEPDVAVTVQAGIAGWVVRAHPREGERVVKGRTVLAQLDRTPMELALQEARAVAAKARQEWEKLATGYRREEIDEAREAVARAEAKLRDLLAGARPQELEQARHDLAAAEATRVWTEREFRRVEELLARELVAAQERDRAWQAYEVARARERAARERLALLEAGARPDEIEAARAEVRQARERLRLREAGPRPEEIAQAEAEYRRAQAAVERVEDELARMTILAPLTGFLVKKYVEVGAWVKPDDRIADLIDLEPVYVVGPVNEREIAKLRPGTPARIVLDAYPGRTFRGEVAQIIPQADPQSRAFPVKVLVPNPEALLKSGMFARVTLEVGGDRKAVFVPKDAVVRRGETTGVFVVEDGVARLRPVRTGQVRGGLIEVLDRALAPGQEVVVLGNETLQDGAKVQKVAAEPARRSR